MEENADFEWFATTDRDWFCSTTSNFAQIFTPEKNILKTLTATTFNHKVGQNIILAVL